MRKMGIFLLSLALVLALNGMMSGTAYAIGTTVNTGADGYAPSVSGSVIAFSTSEWSTGEDLNGDGDTSDIVVRYYDMSTGTVTNTGAVGAFLEPPSVSGSVIAFSTYELLISEDLNGDGDVDDYVIRYFMLEEAPTIDAISEQIDAFLAEESIDNEGIAEASHAFIDQAQAKIDQENVRAATNVLNAFINYVNAQSGKHVSAEAAQALIDSAQTVINNL